MFKKLFRKIVARFKAWRYGKKKVKPYTPAPDEPLPPLHPVDFKPAPVKVVGKKTIVDGELLDIEIHSLEGFTQAEKKFFLETLQLFLYVAESQEFKHAFLNKQWKETRGYSNYALYNMWIGGYDSVERVTDFVFDMAYKIYGDGYSTNGTIGWTYLKDLKIRTDRYFLRKWMKQGAAGRARFAGHICHEQAHSLSDYGMVHNVHDGSFVYEIGDLMTDIAYQVAVKGKKLVKIKNPRK